MRVLPPVEERIRRVIRDARAKDPLITVFNIKLILEKEFNHGFSYQYISKLADKAAREGLIEMDRTKIEVHMQSTRENYRLIREELLKIVYWNPRPPFPVCRAARQGPHRAAKNVVMMDLAFSAPR